MALWNSVNFVNSVLKRTIHNLFLRSLSALCFSALSLIPLSAPAQDMRKIERDIVHCVNRITNWWEVEEKEYEPEALDSLEEYNQMLSDKLVYYCTKYPATISYHFKSFDGDTSNLTILTSADTMLRIYNWDSRLGGTMVFFRSVIEYRSGNTTKAYSKPDAAEEGDPDYYYQRVSMLKANGKTYYIATYEGKYSNPGVYAGVKLFTIEDGKMNDTVHLIKTTTGLHNGIEYEYNQFAADIDYSKYNVHYDENTNTIYIPIVIGEKMTKRFIKYKFTGKYFEKEL